MDADADHAGDVVAHVLGFDKVGDGHVDGARDLNGIVDVDADVAVDAGSTEIGDCSDLDIVAKNCDAVGSGIASISSLPTWPQTHPLALDDALLAHALRSDETGHPMWFKG